ncbi:MAG: TIGR03085 family protein [Pseudonocardia sp.]|nr:TIGR03085 family protein [Pseudonocardia sp.]
MSLATAERAAICDTLDEVGPGRPTLCAGWSTGDLLAHLLVRERQPVAAAGIVIGPLAPVTERAMRGYDGTPWADRVNLLRSGPPLWSPFRLPAFDRLGNGGELFVHHEDVRRGEAGWGPRAGDAERDGELWSLLGRMGKMLYRSSPVGVVLARPSGQRIVAKQDHRSVTITGEPGELVLHGFGRDAVRVEVDGDPADVAALGSVSRGV